MFQLSPAVQMTPQRQTAGDCKTCQVFKNLTYLLFVLKKTISTFDEEGCDVCSP